jgi:ATP-binding cassette subfamily G (WHITE) protein 2 (SNQ2)
MANEMRDRTYPCTGPNLIPVGGPYTRAYASCAGVPGSPRGGTEVSGDAYLEALSFSPSNCWRNFGIIWAWWALFVAITAVSLSSGKSIDLQETKTARPVGLVQYFTTYKIAGRTEASYLTFVRNSKTRQQVVQNQHLISDPEKQPAQDGSMSVSSQTRMVNGKPAQQDAQLIKNTSVFTWRNLRYTVKVPGGTRLLLDNVCGFIKPGTLGALMGSSGAGKTTLLDVLAQRKTEGTIEGEVHVDGRPLPIAFQRSAGYCEQLGEQNLYSRMQYLILLCLIDVHEPLATVREALEFSALLRQPSSTSRADKLGYVDTIVDLLELRDIEDAIVGEPGRGLTVEQRKRLTVGVELASKPSILLFLDEPTSGKSQCIENIDHMNRHLIFQVSTLNRRSPLSSSYAN